MKKYKCTKIVEAEPMTRFRAQHIGLVRDVTDTDEDGYMVKYSDTYSSWSPKSSFEEGYIEIEGE